MSRTARDKAFLVARLRANARVRRHQAKKRNGAPFSIAKRRITELTRLYADRYGPTLPDDDAGLDDARIIVRHMLHAGDPHRAHRWLIEHTPWMPAPEREMVIRNAGSRAKLPKADTLARRLGLTFADRQRLNITTIGAIDADAEARKWLRRERDRQRKAARRRARGARPRHEYEGNSVSRLKPWLTLGISRATWYRRTKTAPPVETPGRRETSASAAIETLVSAVDAPVSPREPPRRNGGRAEAAFAPRSRESLNEITPSDFVLPSFFRARGRQLLSLPAPASPPTQATRSSAVPSAALTAFALIGGASGRSGVTSRH